MINDLIGWMLCAIYGVLTTVCLAVCLGSLIAAGCCFAKLLRSRTAWLAFLFYCLVTYAMFIAALMSVKLQNIMGDLKSAAGLIVGMVLALPALLVAIPMRKSERGTLSSGLI